MSEAMSKAFDSVKRGFPPPSPLQEARTGREDVPPYCPHAADVKALRQRVHKFWTTHSKQEPGFVRPEDMKKALIS